jgi:hypothetical protein
MRSTGEDDDDDDDNDDDLVEVNDDDGMDVDEDCGGVVEGDDEANDFIGYIGTSSGSGSLCITVQTI